MRIRGRSRKFGPVEKHHPSRFLAKRNPHLVAGGLVTSIIRVRGFETDVLVFFVSVCGLFVLFQTTLPGAVFKLLVKSVSPKRRGEEIVGFHVSIRVTPTHFVVVPGFHDVVPPSAARTSGGFCFCFFFIPGASPFPLRRRVPTFRDAILGNSILPVFPSANPYIP